LAASFIRYPFPTLGSPLVIGASAWLASSGAGTAGFRLSTAEVVGFKDERHKPSYRSVIRYVQLSR